MILHKRKRTQTNLSFSLIIPKTFKHGFDSVCISTDKVGIVAQMVAIPDGESGRFISISIRLYIFHESCLCVFANIRYP